MMKLPLFSMEQWLNNEGKSLFDDINLPVSPLLEKETLINTIMLECGEFGVLYADPNFMAFATKNFFNKNYRTFDKWVQALAIKYEPLYNYDRTEEETYEAETDTYEFSGSTETTSKDTNVEGKRTEMFTPSNVSESVKPGKITETEAEFTERNTDNFTHTPGEITTAYGEVSTSDTNTIGERNKTTTPSNITDNLGATNVTHTPSNTTTELGATKTTTAVNTTDTSNGTNSTTTTPSNQSQANYNAGINGLTTSNNSLDVGGTPVNVTSSGSANTVTNILNSKSKSDVTTNNTDTTQGTTTVDTDAVTNTTTLTVETTATDAIVNQRTLTNETVVDAAATDTTASTTNAHTDIVTEAVTTDRREVSNITGPKSKEITEAETTRAINRTDETRVSYGDSENPTTTESNNSANESRKETNVIGPKKRSMRAYGNIGVTTSQQMLASELELDRFNLYNEITKMYMVELTIPVYL